MVMSAKVVVALCLFTGCSAQFGQQPAMEQPMDLGCLTGPHAATWQQVKGMFRGVFPQDGAPTELVPREKLVATLDVSMRTLTDSKALAPESQGECGLGRLALQILTLATIEDTVALLQIFSESETLASPVLTSLLDVNWVLLGQGGWPVFAFLGQINLRKQAQGMTINDEGEGLDMELPKLFFEELKDAMAKTNYGKVIQLSAAFLSADAPAAKTPIAILTAFASQAIALPAGERVRVLQDMQTAFKQMISSAAELDISLSTRWPLWGMMHSAIDPFYAD